MPTARPPWVPSARTSDRPGRAVGELEIHLLWPSPPSWTSWLSFGYLTISSWLSSISHPPICLRGNPCECPSRPGKMETLPIIVLHLLGPFHTRMLDVVDVPAQLIMCPWEEIILHFRASCIHKC